MHHDHAMPMTHEYMEEFKEYCTKEFLNSREGQRYKKKYDELEQEMHQLKKDMDHHVYKIMKSKMGDMKY